jgi:hypothetical protein
MPHSPLERRKIDDWNRTIDINIKGVLYGIAAVLPHTQRQKSGHIAISQTRNNSSSKCFRSWHQVRWGIRDERLRGSHGLLRAASSLTNSTWGWIYELVRR